MATQAKKSSKKQQSPEKKLKRASCRERAKDKRKARNDAQVAAHEHNEQTPGLTPWEVSKKRRHDSEDRRTKRAKWARQNQIPETRAESRRVHPQSR